MLQDIRSNIQGTIAKIIIGLIVVSFSIFGIESLLFSGGTNSVAEVNGEEITAYALQQELSVQQRQLLALMGDNADPALLDEARLSQAALESLVSREIVRQGAAELGLSTSEQAISSIIASMEQFQIDGRFSRDMFQSTLANAGFTPALFNQRLTEDMLIGQLRAGVAGSDFATPAEVSLAASIALEGRDVRYVTLPLVDFRLSTEVSDDEIQAYYDDNSDAFLSEETVVLEYVELRAEDYYQPVDEARVREEFELVRDEYEVPTEARVSHVLLEGGEGESRLQAVEAALEGGMSFADAAKEFSDDIGSADAGGDLGYTAGSAFPEEMEAVIAGLAVGERGTVRTDAGLHLVLVTDRREGSAVTYEEVAGELERRIQAREASDALLRDVERLRDLAFNAIDLAEPAAALDITVKTSDPVSRNQTEGLFANPRIQQAAFSEDVLEAGHNSEVIELGPDEFVALRVASRQPPAPQPLADVRGEIESILRDRIARDAASEQAEALLVSINEGLSVEDAANGAGLQWQVELGATRDSQRIPAAVRDALFAMAAPGDEPRRRIVSDDSDALYVLEFTRVTAGSIDSLPPAQRAGLSQQLAGQYGGVTQQQLEQALRERAEVVTY